MRVRPHYDTSSCIYSVRTWRSAKGQKSRQIVDDVVAWVDKCETLVWLLERWLFGHAAQQRWPETLHSKLPEGSWSFSGSFPCRR
jgi:hypothetical protein